MKDKIQVIVVIFVSLIIFEGCAVFKGSRKINMEPFADNAGILFSEAVKISRPFQFKNLKIYVDVPEYLSIKEKSVPLLRALKGIVYYSHQIVVINNSKLKDKQKNDQLARYLQEVFEKAQHKERIDSIRLNKNDVAIVLNDMRNADKYLDGIAAANPIINTIVLSLIDRLDEIEDGVAGIINVFESQIQDEYAEAIDNYLRLKNLQNSTQKTISMLYLAESRDRAILDTLRQDDLYLSSFFTSKNNVSKTELNDAEEYLFKRLGRIDELIKQLDDDRIEYLAKKDEISQWHLQVDEKLRIARNAITVWAQSHRNLGDGIEVPPLIGIDQIISIAANAASSFVP